MHTDTFVYCCDTLALDPEQIYGTYRDIPSIRDKDELVVDLTRSVFAPGFTTEGTDNVRRFLRDLIGFYVIMEGIFFYAGFAMMLALKRQGKRVGIGEQFEYILRDESLHLAFGCDLIRTLREECPGVWTADFERETVELVEKAVDFERRYALDACPDGLLALRAESFCRYVEHVADRRLERLSIPPLYRVENPFPWMSQAADLAKEKNFFETRVTEYRTGGALTWD